MLKRLFDHLSSHVTVWTWAWPYASGILGVGVLSAVIAQATAWIAPWGPLGWWFSGLTGALFAMLLFFLGAITYSKITDARLKKRVYGSHDKINPLESHFRRQRIKINDLVLPFDPIIHGKTFEDCDLLGPCNVIVMGRTELSHCGGSNVQAAIVALKPDVGIQNAVAFQDCTIRRCRLYQLTFLVPDEAYLLFKKGLNNLEWITRTP